MLPYYLKFFLFNSQKGKKALKVGRQHYDIGNNLYTRMLDKRMVYTCGYWNRFQDLDAAKNLDVAQEHKLETICRKIGLKEGDKVLDIGCGWGSFMHYAAEKYGVKCVVILISKEQVKYGNETKGDLPIEFRLQDYAWCVRSVNKKYQEFPLIVPQESSSCLPNFFVILSIPLIIFLSTLLAYFGLIPLKVEIHTLIMIDFIFFIFIFFIPTIYAISITSF